VDAHRLARLPRRYALALRLRAVGADDGLIAECLDVDPSAIDALLRLAAAKWADLEAAPDPAVAPST
jgi:hypothetical protein